VTVRKATDDEEKEANESVEECTTIRRAVLDTTSESRHAWHGSLMSPLAKAWHWTVLEVHTKARPQNRTYGNQFTNNQTWGSFGGDLVWAPAVPNSTTRPSALPAIHQPCTAT
jgi:hypothetical protein